MAKSPWSTEASKVLDEDRTTKTAEETFTAKGLDPAMNPYGVRVRESRASELSPHPRSIVLGIDGTVSHRDWPMRITRGSLTQLMGLLIDHGFLPNPQVLISMIRDDMDEVPLEVGQFEVDEKIREDLERCFIKASGGAGSEGYLHEAYLLLIWWVATHTACDCFEKEGRKGYLIIAGDEMSNARLGQDVVRRVTGETLENDLTFDEIIRMAEEKWKVIFFYSHSNFYREHEQTRVFEWWKSKLGHLAIHLYDPEDLAVQTAIVTGLLDGSVISLDDGLTRLASVGTSAQIIDRVRRALSAFAASLDLNRPVEGVPAATGKKRRASRL